MASHLAAELVGRFQHTRKPIPSLALTDVATLTAIANDFGYPEVFARSLLALVGPHDAVVLLSASGASPSILKAAGAAASVGALTVALTGMAPNSLLTVCREGFAVPSSDTARIQEAHLLIGHIWCEIIEAACG